MTPPPDDPFLCACRREPTSRVPVWFMRQAGRSLPEYRALRGSGSIIDAIRNPDLATEITLQPVRRYGVDAAILYSDIVTPIAAIGFGVDVEPGVGPVVEHPFATAADLDRIRPLDAEADTPYVLETVHNLVGALGAVPLIGFAGAPFTVASYLVEGRPSRTYARTKALMHGDPELWFALVDRLADLAVASLRSQIAAGASAVQLFDSWAGVLSPPDYERFVLPASRKVLHGVADLGVPRIHFGVGTGEILTLMRDAGADVVGVDWRVPIDVARERLGDTVAVQGNLDPAILSAPWPVVEAQVVDVLDRNGGRPGHIFNLGHGVTPEVDPAVLERVVEVVHSYVPAGAGVAAGVNVNATVGVVVMAYGTPRSADDIQAYYTHIRRGRPPSDDQLANLQLRYRAIGGVSPLAERTESQRAGIQAALDEHAPGRFRVELGQKHSEPFIEDTADTLIRAGVHSIIGLVLAPHFSQASVGEYQQRLADAAEPSGLPVTGIEHWHMEEAYLAFLTDAVAEARATLPANHKVLFTAHSLPERVLVDDPYPDELRESAAEVAQRAGILDWADWSIGWQSAGATPEPWRGPDLLTVIRELGATGRTEGVCICPQGFVADHLEVLYDLDVEAAMVAAEVGLAYARTRSLNDDPTVMAALADRILGLATDAV